MRCIRIVPRNMPPGARRHVQLFHHDACGGAMTQFPATATRSKDGLMPSPGDQASKGQGD
jgi:hypothetical protein